MAHVLFVCPAVANERAVLNISAFKALAIEQGLLTYPEIMASYLRGDGAASTYSPAGTWMKNGGFAGVLADLFISLDVPLFNVSVSFFLNFLSKSI